MNQQWMSRLQDFRPLRGILNHLKNANAFPESEEKLTHLSYESWQRQFLGARLTLAFELALFSYLVRIAINLFHLLQGNPSIHKEILIQAIGALNLILGMVVLRTRFGRNHLGWLLLGFAWALEMNEQIIETLGGVFESPLGDRVRPELLGWAFTFFFQATIIPVRWPLHLASQIMILGYYFAINTALGFDTLPQGNSATGYLFLTMFWVCLICDLSVYLYERLQRAEFKARQKLKMAYRELEMTEYKFRSIFENAVEGLFQSTPDGRFLSVNASLARLYGYRSPEEMIASVTDIRNLYVNPKQRDLFLQRIQEHDAIMGFESQVYRADGSKTWISENARVVRDMRGNVVAYEGNVADITERKQAETEIRKALETEKELNQLKSRFVSMISHEFRTPLTTILAASEALECYGDRWGEEKKKLYLKRIQNTVQQMSVLLSEILILARSEAQKLPFNPAPVDLEGFCRDLVEEMQLNLQANQTLEFHVLPAKEESRDRLPRMDEQLLRHIFSNLLSNAIKYSPPGGKIELTLTTDRDRAICTVEDEGIGIPPEDRKHLFESFHRAKNVGTVPGTGLGLTIVQRSVELQQGTITVETELGKGTKFTVILPLEPEENRENEDHIGDRR